MKKNLLFLVQLFMVFSLSCKKNESVLQESTEKDIFVKNGILHVKDTATLFRVVKNNMEKTPEEIQKWQDSLRFNSYQVFFNTAFNEYEDIVSEMKDNENHMLRFINDYKNYLSFSDDYIDGIRDYTFSPKVNPLYFSVANKDGKLIVGNSFFNTMIEQTNLKGIQGFYQCYKKTKKRKMTIHLFTKFPPNPIYSFQYVWVWHSKKLLWGWVNYKTRYYWRYSAGGYVYQNPNDIPSDTQFSISNSTHYLEIWNRGVGETNKCIFNW